MCLLQGMGVCRTPACAAKETGPVVGLPRSVAFAVTRRRWPPEDSASNCHVASLCHWLVCVATPLTSCLLRFCVWNGHRRELALLGADGATAPAKVEKDFIVVVGALHPVKLPKNPGRYPGTPPKRTSLDPAPPPPPSHCAALPVASLCARHSILHTYHA